MLVSVFSKETLHPTSQPPSSTETTLPPSATPLLSETANAETLFTTTTPHLPLPLNNIPPHRLLISSTHQLDGPYRHARHWTEPFIDFRPKSVCLRNHSQASSSEAELLKEKEEEEEEEEEE